jgi:hypothetical protein
MSNRRQLRHISGGHLARSRDQWTGKYRNRLGRDRSMQMNVSSMLAGISQLRRAAVPHRRAGGRGSTRPGH